MIRRVTGELDEMKSERNQALAAKAATYHNLRTVFSLLNVTRAQLRKMAAAERKTAAEQQRIADEAEALAETARGNANALSAINEEVA